MTQNNKNGCWRALTAQTFSSLCESRPRGDVYLLLTHKHRLVGGFYFSPASNYFRPTFHGSTLKSDRNSFYCSVYAGRSTQPPCLRLAWCKAPSWRRCWRPWRTWSQRPAGTSARRASLCRAWTPLTCLWCSSPCGTTASTRTAATETWPWGSTWAGEAKLTPLWMRVQGRHLNRSLLLRWREATRLVSSQKDGGHHGGFAPTRFCV